VIPLSCMVTESLQILRFLSDQAGLSVQRSHGTWPDTWTCEDVRYWGFKCWLSHASPLVYFRLSVWAVRCYSHLARSCEVFHSWGGKTCGMLLGQSHDAGPESGDTTRVVMSTVVRKCDWSWDIRPESYHPIGVSHTTEVASSDRTRAYDQSRTYN
jgi:hypothetical protein